MAVLAKPANNGKPMCNFSSLVSNKQKSSLVTSVRHLQKLMPNNYFKNLDTKNYTILVEK